MDADHVCTWSRGGKANSSNRELLGKSHDRAMGNSHTRGAASIALALRPAAVYTRATSQVRLGPLRGEIPYGPPVVSDPGDEDGLIKVQTGKG